MVAGASVRSVLVEGQPGLHGDAGHRGIEEAGVYVFGQAEDGALPPDPLERRPRDMVRLVEVDRRLVETGVHRILVGRPPEFVLHDRYAVGVAPVDPSLKDGAGVVPPGGW